MAGTGENVSVFRRLGQILIGARLITPEVLQEGLTRAKSERRRLGDALTTMNAVSQDDVLRALATQQSLPFLAADVQKRLFEMMGECQFVAEEKAGMSGDDDEPPAGTMRIVRD